MHVAVLEPGRRYELTRSSKGWEVKPEAKRKSVRSSFSSDGNPEFLSKAEHGRIIRHPPDQGAEIAAAYLDRFCSVNEIFNKSSKSLALQLVNDTGTEIKLMSIKLATGKTYMVPTCNKPIRNHHQVI